MDQPWTANVLPNELWTMIVDYLQPDDLVSFACCQRRSLRLCEKRLIEHRAKIQHYSKIAISDFVEHEHELDGTPYDYPAHLLLEIEQDPSIARYIRALTYERRALSTTDQLTSDILSETTTFESLRRQLRFLGRDLTREALWMSWANQGDHDALCLLLLALTSNLSMLTLYETLYWNEWPSHAVGSFEKLRAVNIWNQAENPVWFDDLQHWIQLPALQSFSASKIYGEVKKTQHPRHALRRVALSDAEMSGEDLASFLDNVTGVESLEFELAIDFSSSWEWQTAKFLRALRGCALSSLQNLRLHLFKSPSDKLTTLKDFKALRRFHGSLAMLDHTISEEAVVLDLRHCFPTTLEELVLTTWSTWQPGTRHPEYVELQNIADFCDLRILMIDGALTDDTSNSLAEMNVEVFVGVFRSMSN